MVMMGVVIGVVIGYIFRGLLIPKCQGELEIPVVPEMYKIVDRYKAHVVREEADVAHLVMEDQCDEEFTLDVAKEDLKAAGITGKGQFTVDVIDTPKKPTLKFRVGWPGWLGE